ncbi:MAG: SEC-C metal-binding domain-containing protein, partial [Gammaproteobacteria bacterium]
YDDVANDQRKVVYEWRNELLEVDDISDDIKVMRHDVVSAILDSYIPPASMDDMWDVKGLSDAIDHEFSLKLDIQKWLDEDDDLYEENLKQKVIDSLDQHMLEREKVIPPDLMRRLEKDFMLDALDRHWKEHLMAMDHLRQGIGLRSYAAKNPKQEYKREAFVMFSEMLENIKRDVTSILCRVKIRSEEDVNAIEKSEPDKQMQYNHPSAPNALSGQTSGNNEPPQKTPFVRQEKKVGRNEPCPCGSGKKYKHCHGRLA